MLYLLFGWRKASKCKKLIRRVQKRLKLLKNKRCCIVKQLREDVAQLLKHGHEQAAFERVDQLAKDMDMVEIYDLLHHFCEFIKTKMRYIRRHKDCPKEIGEAVSTLIFLSARFGNLPELLCVRTLFEERYGHEFVASALELLPGNLVSIKVIQNLEMKYVPDDVKFRLLQEIASSCLELQPFSLEYKLQDNNGGNQVYIDLPSANSEQQKSSDSSKEPHMSFSEICDEIEEIVSPAASREGSFQEQSMFLFKERKPIQPQKETVQIDEHSDLSSDSFESRISRKKTKPIRKGSRRRRRRSSSRHSRSSSSTINDVECAAYYGELRPETNRRNEAFVHGRKKAYAVEGKMGFPTVYDDGDGTDSSEVESNEGEKRWAFPLRAMTMPSEERVGVKESILRSNTVPLEQPRKAQDCYRHIHPKLPDYDELAAKFMALKKERLSSGN